MSSVINHDKVDVVCLGLGHMSGPIAAELTRNGNTVVGIEKGPYWNYAVDWNPTNIHDEWAIVVERKFDHPLYISSFSIRNTRDQFALPVRRYTKQVQYHALGHGVGGVGTHYGGGLGRFSEWSYKAFSETDSHYPGIMSQIGGSQLDWEDWPVTYAQMEPYYKQWESAIGVSGTDQEPKIPFHGYKFPSPAHPTTAYAQIFYNAATSLGYKPYPHVSGLVSSAYKDPTYGIQRNPCVYCGWCAGACNYPCEQGAKTSSHVTTIPYAISTGKFDMRLNSYGFRIDWVDQGTKKIATGVRYYDAQGNVHFQPASVIFNGLWGYNIVRLMLLSQLGVPYDPVTATGSVGRGLCEGYYPSVSGASVELNVGSNDYSCGNGAGGGYAMMELSDDNYDKGSNPNFVGGIGGTGIGDYRGSGPATISSHLPGKNNFGTNWKTGLKDEKLPTKIRFGIGTSGPTLPLKGHFVDLDPHYNDIYGDPLARVTLDWDPNTWRVADYLVNHSPLITDILGKMGDPSTIQKTSVPESSQHVDWWGHHMRGGARTGTDPNTSVFNMWMQAWDCENVFSSGEICFTFGDNITNGTHPAGAMAYLAADGIRRYLASLPTGGLLTTPP